MENIKNTLNILDKNTLIKEEYEKLKFINENKGIFIEAYLDYLVKHNLDYDLNHGKFDPDFKCIANYDIKHNTTFYYTATSKYFDGADMDDLRECFDIKHPNCIKYLENNKLSFIYIRNLRFENFKFVVDNYVDFNSLCPINPNKESSSTFIDYIVQHNNLEQIKYCYEKGLFPPGYDVKKWGEEDGDIPLNVVEFYKSKKLLDDDYKIKDNENDEYNIDKLIKKYKKCLNILEKVKSGDLDDLNASYREWDYINSERYDLLLENMD